MKYLLAIIVLSLPSCVGFFEACRVAEMDLQAASFEELESTYLRHMDKLGHTPSFTEDLQIEIFKKSGWSSRTILRLGAGLIRKGDTRLQVALALGYTWRQSGHQTGVGTFQVWRYPRAHIYFLNDRVSSIHTYTR